MKIEYLDKICVPQVFFNTFEKTLRSKKPQKTRNKAFGQKLKANIVKKLLASGIFKHLDFSK